MDQNNMPPMANSTASIGGQKKSGTVIAIIVVVLILIIAAIFLFTSGSDVPVDTGEGTVAAQDVPAVTNTSDEVSDIEADLQAATEGLDTQNF